MALHLIPTSYGTFEVEIDGFVPVDREAAPEQLGEPPETAGIGGERPGRKPSGSSVPERWRAVLGAMVHRLVIGDYGGLAADGLVRATDDASDAGVGRWIEEYPGHLVDLPGDAWEYSDCAPWAGVTDGSWFVIVPLWTAEEGMSDLSMEATVWDDGSSITARIDMVHVM